MEDADESVAQRSQGLVMQVACGPALVVEGAIGRRECSPAGGSGPDRHQPGRLPLVSTCRSLRTCAARHGWTRETTDSLVGTDEVVTDRSISTGPGTWPRDTSDVRDGFSDRQLEALAAFGDQLPHAASWLFWPTELYSFGRCYREWIGWPTRLPIPVYGDHGVTTASTFQPHELQNPANVHLTFNGERARLNQHLPNRRVEHVTHPWITYRRRHGIERSDAARGTLVFYSHTNVGTELDPAYDIDAYFAQLAELPSEYEPLVLCLHMHDIHKGYHRELRRYGLPILTAGDTSSPFFVDRWYDLVRRFAYATSNSGGSDVYYCTELGIPYFLYGPEPSRINYADRQNPLGELRAQDPLAARFQERKQASFRVFPPSITHAQRALTSELLGLDAPDNRTLLRALFVREMARQLPLHLRQVWDARLRRARGRGWKGSFQEMVKRLRS